MTRLKIMAVAVLATLCLWFGALPAQAQGEMTFQIRSNYPYKVQIAFYSQDRKGHQWPGPGRAYNLDDSQVHSFRIACQNGEKICYGGWVTGNAQTYWGVGNNSTQRCSNCCYTCNGGATQLINLNR
jgi:hypothetical protein